MKVTIRAGMVLPLLCLVFSDPVLALPPNPDTAMSAEQMLKDAEKSIGEMRGMRDNAETALRKARADKDAARLDCVNEALIALKGVLKLGEDYVYDLQAEHRAGNAAGVKAAYGKLAIARKKMEDLDARVRSCGGPAEEGVVEGKPVIERVLDPDLPNEDPLEALETESEFIEKPPVTSPIN